jgi:hypothetical protein
VARVKVQQRLDAPVVCCAFSADSSLLFAVTGQGTVVAVDAVTGAVLALQQLAAASGGSGAKKQQHPQQQQQVWCSAMGWAMPRASAMAASPNGQLLAVATARGVELLSAADGASLLQPLRQLSLLGEPSAITAVQFNATSRIIAVATAGNSLTAYDVSTGLPTQWSLQHQDLVGELMQQLPGSIEGLSFKPCADSKAGQEGSTACVLAYSAGGFCHLDLEQPLLPAQQEVRYGADGQPLKPRRRPHGTAVSPASAAGRNGRLLQLDASCLLVGHCSRGEVLLLEKPWQEVLQGLLPPVYRHRYGT